MSSFTLYSQQSSYYSYRASSLEDVSFIKAINQYGAEAISSESQDVSSVFHSLINSSHLDSGLLPPGVRAIYPGIVVFERPPSMQLVQYRHNTVDEINYHEDSDSHYCDDEDCDCEYHDINDLAPLTSYYIPVPWQLYIANFSMDPSSKYFITGVRMFFMNSPLNSPDVNIYLPYIPNFFADGSLCNPMLDSFDEINRYQKNIAGVIESAYDWIWNTGFNADLVECINLAIDGKINEFVSSDEFIQGSYRHYISKINYFYEQISSLTPDQVTAMKWPSPSFRHHHTQDAHNNLIAYAFAYQQYLEEINPDNKSSIDPSDENYLETIKSDTEFFLWVSKNILRIDKTYRQFINFHFSNLRSDSPIFSSLLSSNKNKFKSVSSVSNHAFMELSCSRSLL